jgi:hypothetical protein
MGSSLLLSSSVPFSTPVAIGAQPVSNALTASPSGYQLAKDAILRTAAGHHEWPSHSRERLSIFHAVYLEPAGNGKYQPFFGLVPRVYYVFDLGWPVKAVTWFYYKLGVRTDGACVGDADFPRGDSDGIVIAGLASENIIATFVPAELLVAFRGEPPRSKVDEIISRALPGQRVLAEMKPIGYKVSCVPFDELQQARKLRSQPEVRHVELNPHVSLVTPGGLWKVRALVG